MTNAVRAPPALERKTHKFVSKTFALVSDPSSNDIIRWSDGGDSFLIVDEVRLTRLLPAYFAHENVASFIRQLNNYGFSGHKEADGYRFEHPAFRAGRSAELVLVERKAARKGGAGSDSALAATVPLPRPPIPLVGPADERERPEHGVNSETLFAEVERLRAEVDALDATQQSMKALIGAAERENEMLRVDLRAAREAQAVLGSLVESVAASLRARLAGSAESPTTRCETAVVDDHATGLTPVLTPLGGVVASACFDPWLDDVAEELDSFLGCFDA
eukprot:Amastigsp_a2516_142.p1 type:complete len:276 gc:universal Amastigsp_a2516_142:294-1121(+)